MPMVTIDVGRWPPPGAAADLCEDQVPSCIVPGWSAAIQLDAGQYPAHGCVAPALFRFSSPSSLPLHETSGYLSGYIIR